MRRALMFLVAWLVSSLTLTASALASSPSLVISEIYAAGGNAGALYANDYVELFNRGGTTVDVGSWSVQYATAAGNTWSVTPLSGSVAPGRHLLVQLGPTGTVGSPLPAPDVTGTTNLAASGGKIALVHDTRRDLCGASPGSCAGVATLQDLVGYGSATDYEGTAAAPALDATTAAARAGGGCTDTDSNTADFTGVAPAPQSLGCCRGSLLRHDPERIVHPVGFDRRRRRAGDLDRARASQHQLRPGRHGHGPVPALRAHHRLQHPLDRLRADRPSHRVRTCRPAARPHRDEPGRRCRQPRVRRRCARDDPAARRAPTCRSAPSRARRPSRATIGPPRSASPGRCPRSRPATTPARSPSR